MATSKASKDREAVAESLRRHGFGESGIATVFANEDRIAAAAEAKRKAKAVVQEPLDFGDWM